MRPGRASRTAEHNALFRALEARRPAAVRLVDDRLSEAFLSWRYRALLGPWRAGSRRLIDRRWPGVRTAVVARTRLIDDTIGEIAGDCAQVVVLGAGFDTRAWRLASLAGVPVFEVDHPDTQRRKRDVLGRVGAGRSDVAFIPTDFHLGRLRLVMDAAGYDPGRPTLFLWEGTTNYLDAGAVDATLRWCTRAAAGSHLVFTYIDRAVLTDPGRYEGAARVLATVQRVGEQMTFGLAPEGLAAYLDERGLRLLSDTGAAGFRATYYGEAARAMRGHEFYRVAHARM